MFLNLDFQDGLRIVDTHCHLDSEAFKDDLDETLNRAFKNGIDKIIIPGADIKDLPMQLQLLINIKTFFLQQECILMKLIIMMRKF